MVPSTKSWIFVIAVLAASWSAFGEDASEPAPQPKPQLKMLGVGVVAPTKSLTKTCQTTGQAESLDHLVDSLNEHLMVAFQNTHKFEVVARSDLAQLIKEQQLPDMITDSSEMKSLPGKIKKLDYLLLSSVTDFKDQELGLNVEGQGLRVNKRSVQATLVLKIFNTSTGSLMQSIVLPIGQDQAVVGRTATGLTGNGAVDNSLIEALVAELAVKGSSRVVDLIFPPRVIGVTGDTVTINRGEGSGVAMGQVWEAFAQGKDMVDPDTGVVLGREEIKLGEITITDVLPKFSKGRLIGEDRGIDAGAVVRPKIAVLPAGAPVPH